MTAPFLACDWGTTNLRAWVIDADGQVLKHETFPCGVSKLAPGQAKSVLTETVRPALDAAALPAIFCGMIGSELGWKDIPHRPCPIDLAGLARSLIKVDCTPAETWIVPGLKCQGITRAPDLIRGEETQILGWLASARAYEKGRHVICHPGTHAKWALVEDGAIERFVTAMTGELFDLLLRHSLFKTQHRTDDIDAFDDGLRAAGDGGALLARLFSARARVVSGGAAPDSTASYISGLLIGAEVSAVPHLLGITKTQSIVVIGDAGLSCWYGRALEAAGWTFALYSGESAAVRGLTALHRMSAR